ncbi:membrane protein [Oleiphilus messinensis]|uniref:Membrane protein n=1 Tax=Oleiphilus messinensis TaxID=141451 RepID=A0A1Y0IGC6_9GAMM|nr:DMT family transporter [Oleiphilus messinensis]ARU59179.1 membrane protein [Oleiphilus messinensis]
MATLTKDAIGSTRDSTQKSSPNLIIHGLMVLVIVLVATSFPIGAAITHGLPPDVMMMLRFFTAAALFAPFVLLQHGLQLPSGKSLFGYSMLSIPLVTCFWTMFEALRYTTAVNTGAIYTLVPAITAIFAFFLNNERASRRRSIGLLLGTTGALWIVFRGNLAALIGLDLNYGDLIFMGGITCMSFYSSMIKHVYRGEPMVVMTFWVILTGGIWLLCLSANTLSEIEWSAVDPKVYGGILYLSVFTTLTTFFLIQYGTVKIGPTKVAAYGFLNPIFVLLMTTLLGTHQFTWAYVPGVVLVVLAMGLIQTEGSTQ